MIEIVSIIVDKSYRPQPTNKILLYSDGEISELLTPQITTLLKKISSSEELGKIEWLELSSSRAKCSELQINFNVDFENARGSQILAYGKTIESGFKMKQFQFKRGERKSPSKNSPLHRSSK